MKDSKSGLLKAAASKGLLVWKELLLSSRISLSSGISSSGLQEGGGELTVRESSSSK